MAAISQPGSRAGIVTALVIFVVLFFVSAIFAIVQLSDAKQKTADLTKLKQKYHDIVTDSELTSPEYDAVKALQQEGENQGRSAFDILVHQREDLAKLITGNAN